MENGFLGRKALLSHVERRYIEHEIDGIGKVRIQSLNAAEATELASVDDALRPVAMVKKSLVDAEGNRIFRDSDDEALKEVDSRIINELCGVIGDHVSGAPAGN